MKEIVKELDRILNVLKEKEVTASFFITGDFVKRFPDLTIRLANDGHVICNHSYSHHKIQSMTKQELSDDLTKLENGTKISLEELKFQDEGFYYIENKKYFSIINIKENKVEYLLNKVEKC